MVVDNRAIFDEIALIRRNRHMKQTLLNRTQMNQTLKVEVHSLYERMTLKLVNGSWILGHPAI